VASKYWSGVGKRIGSLAKTAIKTAAPVAIDAMIVSAVNKVCDTVETKLNEIFKKSGINTLISFLLNLDGILLLARKPFGIQGSRIGAMLFFSGSFIFWIVRGILFWKNYGKTTIDTSKCILKKKSVSKGIETYILQNFPVIARVYTGVAISSEVIPYLKEVPEISDLVKVIVRMFWKKVAIFVSVLAVYTVVVLWILKPLLVSKFY